MLLIVPRTSGHYRVPRAAILNVLSRTLIEKTEGNCVEKNPRSKSKLALIAFQLGENVLNENTEFIRLGDFRRLDMAFVLGDKSVEGKSCELEITTQRSNCVNTTFKIYDVEEPPCISRADRLESS